MSGRGALAGVGTLLGCAFTIACTPPAPPPDLPGTFVGAFDFSGALLLPGQDAGVGMETSCVVGLDGGLLNPAVTLAFFAYVSEDVDAGNVWWQMVSNGSSGPIQPGFLDGGGFNVEVSSCAPTAGCGCVGSVDETLVLSQISDGGLADGLRLPVLSFSGWIDDRLEAAASAVCLDAGGAPATACSADAGLGCGLDCDLVYTLSAVPGQPPL